MSSRPNVSVTALSIAAALLLSGCTSKKTVFKNEMTAWLKAHKETTAFCTNFKITSFQVKPKRMTNFRFYLPGRAFLDATRHPIIAISSKATAPSEMRFLNMMQQAGFFRTVPVTYVRVIVSQQPTKHNRSRFGQLPVQTMKTIYKYEKTRRIAYVVSNLNSGFKVRQISFLVGAIPTNFTDRPPMKYMAVNGLMNNIESGLLIPDWCGGTISIIKINDYTVPAPSRGIIMSTAMATARLSKLPGWLSSPAARAVMANKPDRDYLAHARFEQTSSGWKIMGRVSLPELIGPAGGF